MRDDLNIYKISTPHITTDHHRVPACRGLAVVVRGGGGEESAAPRSQCRGSRLRVSTGRAAHWATREETSHRDNISPAQPSPARYQGSLCQMDQCQCQHVTHAALHKHLMLTRLRWVEEWNGGRWVLGTCKEFNKSVGDLFISNILADFWFWC